MAVPYIIATASLASGSTTYNVPVNTASSTAGDAIIVISGVGGTAPPALSTVTDSKSNSYTQQQQTSASPFIAVFESNGNSALVNGTDQLTLTFAAAATGGFGVAVIGTPGLNVVDVNTTPATGNSTAPSVSGTPTASGEIALGLFVWANAGLTGTIGGTGTQLTQVHPTGGAFTTVAYVSSPTSGVALTFSYTITSGAWRAMVLSLKAGGTNATATPATLNASAGFPPSTTDGTPFWFTNAAFIVNLNSIDPVTTAKFFNTPAAFALSNSQTTVGTLPGGFTTTPMLKYISYGQFWADVTGSSKTISGVTYTPVAISASYQWLMYDTEFWSPNPPSPYASAEAQAEMDDPWTYMANFVTLAHANGFKVLLPPARDLGNNPTSVNPLSSETLDAWYTRTNLIGTAAATGAEIVHIQSQADQGSSQFATFWNAGYTQAQTADVQTPVASGVSTTSPGGVTAPQMFAAAQSVIGNAAGFWLNMSSGTASTAVQFLLLMSGTPAPDVLNATAGFPAPAVATGEKATPAVLTANATFPAPAVSNGTTAAPATLAATASFPAPAASSSTTLSPATLAATTSFPAPAVSGGAIAHPATLTASAGFPAPSVGQAVTSPTLELSGFGSFPQIPAGSIVSSVIATIAVFGSDAGIRAPSYELWDYSGTPTRIGSAQTGTASTSAQHTDTVTFTGVSYSQLATLRLQIHAASDPSNTGATESVDAAALEVVWSPAFSVTIVPALPAVTASVLIPSVTTTSSATAAPAVLAVSTSFPLPQAGRINAALTPSSLGVLAAFPLPSPGAGVLFTVSSLTALAGFPAPALSTNATANYATAVGTIAGGSGSWTATGSATGPPDAADALWTVP